MGAYDTLVTIDVYGCGLLASAVPPLYVVMGCGSLFGQNEYVYVTGCGSMAGYDSGDGAYMVIVGCGSLTEIPTQPLIVATGCGQFVHYPF
jgi:hypothetical protein